MKTVKTSRRFDGSPISIRALCRLEDRTLPFGLLDVVATDGVRHFSGQLSAGDVDCTWEMMVWQNGFWSVKGDFHDGGTLAGDFFNVEFLLDTDHGVGTGLKGSILDVWDSRHISVSNDGSDSWIRENWHKIEGSGPTVTMYAAPAVGMIVEKILIALAIVVAAAIAGSGKSKYEARRCPDDPWRDPGQPCIQFVPVNEQPVNEQ